MAKYVIPWTISGDFACEAETAEEAAEKFKTEWKAGAIQPRRDGTLWVRRPIDVE